MKSVPAEAAGSFPFNVPAIRSLSRLDFDTPVTLFVGENGPGKSTLLEGIAAAAELPTVGGADVEHDPSLAAQRRLGASLRLAWNPRSRSGFFLRAEDFFGYLKSEARTDARLVREFQESHGAPAWPLQAADLGTLHVDEVEAAKHLQRRDQRSHGESFLELFSRRVRPRGLYLLDEPEAPLSVTRQLKLLKLLLSAGRGGAQFVIATHSPILQAMPGAQIVSFDQTPLARVAYGELGNVRLMREFLNNPEAFLRKL